MKHVSNLISKVLAKIQENPAASTKFGVFVVILVLAYAYPTMAAIIGALACMIAIDQRAKAKESLSFLKVPVDVAKLVAAETKVIVDAKKAEKAEKAAVVVEKVVKPEDKV